MRPGTTGKLGSVVPRSGGAPGPRPVRGVLSQKQADQPHERDFRARVKRNERRMTTGRSSRKSRHDEVPRKVWGVRAKGTLDFWPGKWLSPWTCWSKARPKERETSFPYSSSAWIRPRSTTDMTLGWLLTLQADPQLAFSRSPRLFRDLDSAASVRQRWITVSLAYLKER